MMHVASRFVSYFVETVFVVANWFSATDTSVAQWSFSITVAFHPWILSRSGIVGVSWSTVLWSFWSLRLIIFLVYFSLLAWNTYFINFLVWVTTSPSLQSITFMPVWCILIESFHLTLTLSRVCSLCPACAIFWCHLNHLLYSLRSRFLFSLWRKTF